MSLASRPQACAAGAVRASAASAALSESVAAEVLSSAAGEPRVNEKL